MNRRLFVGTSSILATGICTGMDSKIFSTGDEKFDKIQRNIFKKVKKQLEGSLESHSSFKGPVPSFLTPSKVLFRTYDNGRFYIKFLNVHNEVISITEYDGEIVLKVGEAYT